MSAVSWAFSGEPEPTGSAAATLRLDRRKAAPFATSAPAAPTAAPSEIDDDRAGCSVALRHGQPSRLLREVYSCRVPLRPAAPLVCGYNSRHDWIQFLGYHLASREDRGRTRPERRLNDQETAGSRVRRRRALHLRRPRTDGKPSGQQTARPPAATTGRPSPARRPRRRGRPSAAAQRALLDRYCVSCHNQQAKAAGQEPARKLTLDDLDPATRRAIIRTDGNSSCGSSARA